jgi:hypothetical protein
MRLMQHSDIERDCLIDRYVRNTLSAVERQPFEEHFLDCPQCLEQLEIASSLRQAVRESEAGVVPASRAAPPSRRFVWNWVQAGLAACLVVAVVASMAFFQQMRRAKTELASAQLIFEHELGSVRGLASPPEVYTLGQSRGSNEIREIALPREPRWMVFSVEMDTTQFQSYRAILNDHSGKEVWRRDGIQVGSPDAIGVAVPSNVLSPGVYALAVETGSQAGTPSTLIRVPLRFK